MLIQMMTLCILYVLIFWIALRVVMETRYLRGMRYWWRNVCNTVTITSTIIIIITDIRPSVYMMIPWTHHWNHPIIFSIINTQLITLCISVSMATHILRGMRSPTDVWLFRINDCMSIFCEEKTDRHTYQDLISYVTWIQFKHLHELYVNYHHIIITDKLCSKLFEILKEQFTFISRLLQICLHKL